MRCQIRDLPRRNPHIPRNPGIDPLRRLDRPAAHPDNHRRRLWRFLSHRAVILGQIALGE